MHIPSFELENYSTSGNIFLFLLIDSFSKILCNKNLLSSCLHPPWGEGASMEMEEVYGSVGVLVGNPRLKDVVSSHQHSSSQHIDYLREFFSLSVAGKIIPILIKRQWDLLDNKIEMVQAGRGSSHL